MDWKRDTYGVLMRTTDALKLLPNVKPRVAMRRLEEIDNMYLSCDENEFRFLDEIEICDGLRVTRGDFDELRISGEDGGSKRISPRGASLLLKLYGADIFELKGGKGSVKDTGELRQYSESEKQLVAKVEKLKAHEKQKKERERYLVANPDQVLKQEFTPSLLNKIMFENGAVGGHAEMLIGGVLVTKIVQTFVSNSGNSRSNTVTLVWTDSSGTQHKEILTQSSYADNRRNDAERNYGLPE